ncbi:hypothetical protein [uncultured Roseovarius sp.]|uniref:hypothetical protein n=1 Tax=uncultured Roseovarius sp. TaxID=293344 RepID=UPI00260152DA|nr:hypothetical protein [uncultured Roseovarius sp.]
MSHIIQSTKAARHARLFELIRQRNIASQVPAQVTPANPAEAQLFRLQAERSISSVQPAKLAS